MSQASLTFPFATPLLFQRSECQRILELLWYGMRIEMVERWLGKFHVHVALQMVTRQSTHRCKPRGIRVGVFKIYRTGEMCSLLIHFGVVVTLRDEALLGKGRMGWYTGTKSLTPTASCRTGTGICGIRITTSWSHTTGISPRSRNWTPHLFIFPIAWHTP